MNRDNWTFKTIFKNQTKLAAYIIICTTLVVLGASYALFFQVDSNSNNQVIEAGDLTFTYSNESVISNTTCFQPMNADEANLYANTCSYQLSIRNTGSLIADYNLFLVPREDNTANLSNLKIILRQNGTPLSGYPKGIVSGTGDNTHVGTTDAFLTGSINPGETILYSAQIYVDDTTSFAGSENKKVSIDIRGALRASDANPLNSTKPNEYTLASLQTLNPSLVVTPSTATNPDFSKAAPSTEFGQTSGLFELPDDYGTSYYFRGNVDNNYVKFAGYYWRIIRINGDGTIRMIYAGDASVIDGLANKAEVLANGFNDSFTQYTQIETSAFNSSYNDNAYVGYMYGAAGSGNYNDTHANTNSSTIKTYLDTWYENNLKNTTYESYIVDSIFCNDRSVASEDTIGYANSNFNPSTPYTTNAFGTNWTIYGAWGRGIEQFDQGLGNRARLTCPNKNDAFTVTDTTKGNGALDYPVGLITIDEENIAGGIWDVNYNYYLKTGNLYWTGSPRGFNVGVARVEAVYNDGNISGARNVTTAGGVRPVINILPSYINSGDGTASNPFTMSLLEINVNIINSPSSGNTWTVGDDIEYTVSVKNVSGQSISDIELIDNYGSDEYNIGSLASNDTSTTFNSMATVVEEDLVNGYVELSFDVSGISDGNSVSSSKSYMINNVESANPSVSITYGGLNSSYSVGDTINYTVTILNNGNLSLSNVEVTSPDADGSQEYSLISSGYSEVENYAHTIAASEIENGHITLTITLVATTVDTNNPTLSKTETYEVAVN